MEDDKKVSPHPHTHSSDVFGLEKDTKSLWVSFLVII